MFKEKESWKIVKYEKSCGAIIYRTTNDILEYLLLKSARESRHWGFAKGHMEPGESEEETCTREVFEETGIEIKIEDDFRVSDRYITPDNIDKEVILFLGNAKGQSVSIQEEEIADYRWCNYDEAMELLTFEGSREKLKEANKFLA